jgi:hypothetical protein
MAVAVWTELVVGMQTVLQGLGLIYTNGAGVIQALPADRVYRRRLADDRNTTPPCLLVVQGPKEEVLPGDFEDLEVRYPVLMVHEFATNQDLTPNDDELRWRQQIIDALDQWETTLRPLVLSAHVTMCEIDTQPVIDPTLFLQANVDVGGIMAWFRTLRGRGNRG